MDEDSLVISTVDYDSHELTFTWNPFTVSSGADYTDIISDQECRDLCVAYVSAVEIELVKGTTPDGDYELDSS